MSNEANPYSAPGFVDPSETQIGHPSINRRALLATARGLSVYYWGIIILILSLISVFVIVIFPPGVFVSLLGAVLGGVMLIVGMAMCIAVPRETNARGLIIASLILQLINVAAGLVDYLVPDMPMYFDFVGDLFGLIGTVLFLMFLRRVTLYVRHQDLAKRAMILIAMVLLLIPFAIGAGVAAAVMGETGMLLLGALGIFVLITFVMFVNLINNTRHAIRLAVDGSEQKRTP